MNEKSKPCCSREILRHLIPTLILICLVITPVHGIELSLTDPTPEQGDVVWVRVSDATICNPTFEFQSREITIHETNRGWRSLLGIDLESETGPTNIQLNAIHCETGETVAEQRTITIQKGDYPTQHLTIEDGDKVSLSDDNLDRVRRESKQIDQALNTYHGNKLWYSPFANPVNDMSPGNSFGSQRVINGQLRSPHSGEDYDANIGDPIRSIAAGRVSLVGHFFFAGRAVFINHGHGLHSMYFHLSEIDVDKDEFVQEGQRIGYAGMSGRTTGPHLHLGVQLHGNTVDPDQLLFMEQ